jgi:DNA (cytosine-5)-methyltransferase 1
MKLLSLFSGIGAFEKALSRQNISYELVGFSEIDKYAITAYCAIHGVDESLNLGDITKIDLNKVPDCDIITHGSPCQSFSVAGKGDGGDKGSGTRSSLMWYTVEIVKHKLPKYVIWENVKGVLSKKHKHNFDQYLNELEKLGYNNYYRVLNSKDYGIPQNRERIYVISIRKDIDKGHFKFPEPFDNGLRLKDLLENEVEEKYYIDNEKTEKLLSTLNGKEILPGEVNVSKKGEVFDNNTEVASCLLARDYKGLGNQSMTAVAVPCLTPDRMDKRQNGRRFKTDGEPMFTLTAQDRHGVLVGEPRRLGGLYDSGKSRRQAGSVWDKEGIAPTLDTMQGGHREPLIIDENKLKFVGGLSEKDWAGDGKKLSRNYPQGERVYDSEGIVCSQTSQGRGTGSYTGLYLIDYRIRKLTPLECWRLMDFDDEDYWKARRALERKFYNGRDRSNSQMYKMAGNSITVGVLELIFKNLFI